MPTTIDPALPVIDYTHDGEKLYSTPDMNRPIYRALSPNGELMWVITGYDDCALITRDLRFSQTKTGTLTAEERAALPTLLNAMEALEGKNMLEADQPVHTRLRGLVHKAFTPRLIENMRPRIQQIVDDLIDAIQQRGEANHQRSMEFVDEFAFPMPVIVIAELLGLPTEDRDKFRRWTHVLTTISTEDTEHADELALTATEFTQYLADLFEARRVEPRADLITGLVSARDSGDKLDEAELHSMVLLLLAAGHETTVNLLGNSLLALMQNPDQLAALRAQPDLIDSAIEEFLRYCGPIHFGMRYAKEDVSLHDVVIQRGDTVYLGLPAANRDLRRFDNPDKLDLSRVDNRHLSFGQGIHYCLGAPLARLEVKIALTTLLRRFPHLALDTAHSWEKQTNNFTHGVRVLPLVY